MNSLRKPGLWSATVRILPLACLLVGWEAASRTIERGAFFYGAPSRIVANLARATADGSLLINTGVTLFEVVAGLLLGTVIGTAIGLGLWYAPGVAFVVKPYVATIGSIPILALAPIVVLWFGIGLWAKIFVVASSTVVVATTQAFAGAANADSKHIELLTAFGATRLMIFRKVLLPSSLSWLIAGYRINVGMAILGAFVGEFISSEVGLGHLIITSMGLFNTSMALAGVFMLCVISLGLISLLETLKAKFAPWA